MNQQPTGFPHRRLRSAIALVLGDSALKPDQVRAPGLQSRQPLLVNTGISAFSPFLIPTN
jgi:hypothetical protein